METGSILNRKRSGRPSIDEETVDAVRAAQGNQFVLHRMNLLFLEAQFTKFYMNDFDSMLTSYKLFKLLSRMITLADQFLLKKFFSALMMTLTTLTVFSDEATFHVSGKVNKHNIQIWGSENPCEVVEKERDSPKINAWCGLMHNQIIGPFIFAESIITANIYLDMLKYYVVSQLEEFQPWVVFQQDGAPPHWGLIVRDFLNETLTNRWIGRNGPTLWPPRFPDITPLDFFL